MVRSLALQVRCPEFKLQPTKKQTRQRNGSRACSLNSTSVMHTHFTSYEGDEKWGWGRGSSIPGVPQAPISASGSREKNCENVPCRSSWPFSVKRKKEEGLVPQAGLSRPVLWPAGQWEMDEAETWGRKATSLLSIGCRKEDRNISGRGNNKQHPHPKAHPSPLEPETSVWRTLPYYQLSNEGSGILSTSQER
jgi:hypothetical protein